MYRPSLALLSLLTIGAAVPAAEPPPVETLRLDNGLTVLLRPIKGAKSTALVTLFSIGGDHDPKDRSGLAHLLEHIYFTAAAGPAKARTVEEVVQRYPAGWNAQTGDDYTVIATVFPAKDLDQELQDAAARMSDLRPTDADLEREKPRIDDELANMFGRMPVLAAMNQAREVVRPTPLGGRKGGVPAAVRAIPLAEVQERWKRYYKPRNALLVLTGALDVKAARRTIIRHFVSILAGDAPPAREKPGKAKAGEVREVRVKPLQLGAGPQSSLAYAAPAPDSELYAPFLILAARLQANQVAAAARPQPVLRFMPLDDSAAVYVTSDLGKEETGEQALARLDQFVAGGSEAKRFDNDVARVKQWFGFLLGLSEAPDAALANNPYGVAFSLGRRHQLGIDPAKLTNALEAVTEDDLRRAAALFAKERRGAAVIQVAE